MFRNRWADLAADRQISLPIGGAVGKSEELGKFVALRAHLGSLSFQSGKPVTYRGNMPGIIRREIKREYLEQRFSTLLSTLRYNPIRKTPERP